MLNNPRGTLRLFFSFVPGSLEFKQPAVVFFFDTCQHAGVDAEQFLLFWVARCPFLPLHGYNPGLASVALSSSFFCYLTMVSKLCRTPYPPNEKRMRIFSSAVDCFRICAPHPSLNCFTWFLYQQPPRSFSPVYGRRRRLLRSEAKLYPPKHRRVRVFPLFSLPKLQPRQFFPRDTTSTAGCIGTLVLFLFVANLRFSPCLEPLSLALSLRRGASSLR